MAFWPLKQRVHRSFSLPPLHASLEHTIVLLGKGLQLLLSKTWPRLYFPLLSLLPFPCGPL